MDASELRAYAGVLVSRRIATLCACCAAALTVLAGAGAVTAHAAVTHAAVTVTRTQVVLSTPGAVVRVQRDPYRMAFARTATGPALLSEVSASRTLRPRPLAPAADPVAPGIEPLASGQLYAPLAFLVGTQTYTQYDGGLWGGNLELGQRTGVQYAATRVLAVHRRGAGVALTVATNDPGRTLTVVLAPAGAGRISVVVDAHPAAGVALLGDAFASPAGEAFYGFGGRHNAVDQRGEDLADWASEENLSHFEGAQGLYPNGNTAAYDPQAQFTSSRGYGFLLDNDELSWLRMDSDRADAWSVAVDAHALSYVVAPSGSVTGAVGAVTALSGRQPAPPAWALGPMLDRLVKNFGETEADYEGQMAADLSNLARYRIPITAYRIEGWGFNGPTGSNHGLSLHTFVSPSVQAHVISELRARHVHPLAYLRPLIVPGSAPDREGLTVRDADGGTALTSGTTGTKIALLDFTNPAAVRWWSRQIADVLNLGFDGFMADFGEEVLASMRFHDGSTGATMHNRYLVLYMRATREAVDAYERAHPGRQIWFFNRGGFTGSAAYEGGNFPGDETTSWDHASGLASVAPDMLSRAVGGAFGYTTDIGGYFDLTTPPTTKQLLLRWAEWAALSPIFRLHGSGIAGTHTPWSYDTQTVDTYRALSQLHLAAAGLILRLWRSADVTGIPPTRPLWLAFPGDRALARIDQEWMLGADVLVAPVVTEDAVREQVTFPPGCWREPQSGRTVHGPAVRAVAAPLTVLPFFFRCGTRPFRVPGSD